MLDLLSSIVDAAIAATPIAFIAFVAVREIVRASQPRLHARPVNHIPQPPAMPCRAQWIAACAAAAAIGMIAIAPEPAMAAPVARPPLELPQPPRARLEPAPAHELASLSLRGLRERCKADPVRYSGYSAHAKSKAQLFAWMILQ